MIDFVNHKGESIIPAGDSPSYKAAPRAKKDADQKFHKGWRVVGHAPGALEKAIAYRLVEIEEWKQWTPAERQQRYPIGIANAGFQPIDPDTWRQLTRKTSVRSKAYEVRDSAFLCADMARKAGWIDVEVIELSKGA